MGERALVRSIHEALGLSTYFDRDTNALAPSPLTCAAVVDIPHVPEFNRPKIAEQLELAAEAAGIQVAGRNADDVAREAIAATRNFARELRLPSRLRDVGASRADFDSVATHVLGDYSTQNNPRPVTSKEQVLEILDRAY